MTPNLVFKTANFKNKFILLLKKNPFKISNNQEQ